MFCLLATRAPHEQCDRDNNDDSSVGYVGDLTCEAKTDESAEGGDERPKCDVSYHSFTGLGNKYVPFVDAKVVTNL